jgi:hypothetical protein
VKNKFRIIGAIALVVLIISGGIYAYTCTTALGTINVPDPTGNIVTVNTTPTQPDWDDILTQVSNTESFRPNGAGDETVIDDQEPDSGAHWDKVDEVTSDGDNTYVYTENKKYREDLYHIPDHSTQTAAGDIDNVEVYMVSKGQSNFEQESVYAHIKTGGSEYNGTEEMVTTNYATYSYQWDTNPQTTVDWTWDDIDALQIGIGLRSPRDKGARFARCTQNYVEVDFDAPLLTDNTPLGDLFEIYEHPDYDGDLSVKVYLTNTGNLTKAYEYLNIELYLEDSVEAPNYRLLSLFNGVATFRLENPVSDNHILSVTGGSYTLKSREPDDWEAGYTVTPELYCEVTQR